MSVHVWVDLGSKFVLLFYTKLELLYTSENGFFSEFNLELLRMDMK